MQWFRWWTGTCSDPKFALVAQRAKQPKAVVLAVWAAILEAACTEEDEGRFSISPEELALTLDLDVNVIKTTIKELRARKLLTRNRIAAWNKRQFPSDNSTQRTRKHRMNMRNKERSGNVPGTLQGTRVERSGNAPETEAEAEAEEVLKGLAPPAADAPPVSADEPESPKLSPQQQIIAEAWEAHELGPLPKKCRGYSGLVALVQTKGLPLVQEWIAHVQRAAPCPPEGAEPWKWFCDSFRAAMNRPWEWKRGETRAGRGLPGQPHEYAGGRVNDW